MQVVSRTAPKYALDSNDKPVRTVRQGETFAVETHDCRTGTILRPDQVTELKDTRFINPATGPIYVEGLRAGRTICIEIKRLEVDSRVGLMLTRPGVTALTVTDEPCLRIVSFENEVATVGPFRVAAAPMIGVIGVAPSGQAVPTLHGGEHGGNMDTILVKARSRVYLPTFVDGAFVYFGDVHAAMGDGEVFLTGVEIAGRIEAEILEVADWSLPTPLVETDDVVAVISAGATFDEAAAAVLAKAVELLAASGMSRIDAGFFMSAIGDLRVSQYLPGARLIHCRFELPKSALKLNGLRLPGLLESAA